MTYCVGTCSRSGRGLELRPPSEAQGKRCAVTGQGVELSGLRNRERAFRCTCSNQDSATLTRLRDGQPTSLRVQAFRQVARCSHAGRSPSFTRSPLRSLHLATMHHCLCVHDVLIEIFELLDDYVYDTAIPTLPIHREEYSLRTLAALARTCRTFQEPAQAVLWRNIPDLFVIVKNLLPTNLTRWDDRARTLVSAHSRYRAASAILTPFDAQYLTASPDRLAWHRLDPYVDRINALGLPLPYPNTLGCLLDPDSALLPLESYLASRRRDDSGEKNLIPNLQHVIYHHAWEEEGYARILLTPRLRTLQLPLILFSVCTMHALGFVQGLIRV